MGSIKTTSAMERKNSNLPTAMCLRFRNKGNVVSTIEEHIKLIDEKGFVWWGWWAKLGENAPELITKHKIEASSISIFLINPNDKMYYKAEGEKFASLDGEDMACPEPTCAPAYYQNMRLKIWLKITGIRAMEEPEEKQFFSCYSFCHVREHLADKGVGLRDIEFNDCQANCIETFTMQPVSIWFLRDRIPSDEPVSEDFITIWKESKQRRANFSKYPYKTKTDKIMIMSDLHFGDHHAFTGKTGEYKNLAEAVIKMQYNEQDRQSGGNAKELYSGLIISGDFTWAAKPKEFDAACKFIGDISANYGLKPEQLAIVPGNHDIRFRDDDKEGPSAPIEIATIKASQNYRKFYKKVYNGLTPEEPAFCMGRRIETKYGLPIEIVCLDSNILQQSKDHFVGQGFVGMEQLDRIKREMELLPEHFSYRILVLHHNILQASYQEEILPDKSYSVLLDCGRILDFIKEYRINLVIHGHNHANLVTGITLKKKLDDPNDYDHFFHIIAIGSTGVKDCDNAIGELEFRPNGDVLYRRRRILTKDQNESGVRNGEIEHGYALGNAFQR